MSDFSSQADRDFLDTSQPEVGTRPGAGVDAGLPADATSGEGDDIVWSAGRARLLGALIEKALATPQNYPLSVNALVAACNQTTNRDPIMDQSEGEIDTMLAEAKTDGWVRFVHPRSGRGVTKYRHVVDEVLGLDDAQTALLGVLLLRGPQTAGELRTRTERLAPMDDATVDEVLSGLSHRAPQPLVRRLDREPGHRERRWIQLLCPGQGQERAGEPTAGSPRRVASTGGPAAGGPSPDDVDALRAELAAVRAELAALRADFDAFRGEFG